MNCLQFSHWLENRDMFDVSEADKAMKHADQCNNCMEKFGFDESLDKMLCQAMKSVDLPGSLKNKVDLSLDKMTVKPSRSRQFGWFGALSAALVATVIIFLTIPFSEDIPSMDELGKYVLLDHDHHDDSVLVVYDTKDLASRGDILVPYTSIKKELPKGYEFVGARICPLGDCEAVHLVFRNNGQRVSLYLVKEQDVDFTLTAGKKYTVSDGDRLVRFWKTGKYIFAMTS